MDHSPPNYLCLFQVSISNPECMMTTVKDTGLQFPACITVKINRLNY